MSTTLDKRPQTLSGARIAGLLALRLVLFALFQAVIAVLLLAGGVADAWTASAAWWPIAASASNLVNLGILARWSRLEGFQLRDFWLPARANWRRNLPVALLTLLIAAPLATLPTIGLAALLFGAPDVAWSLLVQPLPLWAVIVTLTVFPVTMALTELPMYYGYLQPRIAALGTPAWVVVLLPALFHSLQHATLPLLFDLDFALWRGVQFLLFALVLSFAIRRRPRLLPYFVPVHFLLDLQAGIGILLL